jgi:hypothetical protein
MSSDTKTTDPRALRRQILAEQNERNAAAAEEAEAAKAEHERFRALSPANQKRELRQRHQANLAEQAKRNEEAGVRENPAPRRIAGLGLEPDERKPVAPPENKPRTPVRETKKDDGLDSVDFTTDAVRQKARAAGLTAASFKRKKASGKGGAYTVADVERIAEAK